MSFLKRKTFIVGAMAAALLLGGTTQLQAFCFSNNSLSHEEYIVKQITSDLVKARQLAGKCFSKPTAECLGETFWEGAKLGVADIGREIIGRGSFSQKVRPDEKKCCNWKDKGCNPGGKKTSKIVFQIQKMKYRNVRREAQYQGIKTGIKYNAKVGEVEWGAVMEIGATDHVECRFDTTRNFGCKNYVWPESPYHPNQKTVRGVMIKSAHSGKCLDVWGRKNNNGANVAMARCHGGKNQRWAVYKNGTIRSEMNRKCLDVAVRDPKSATNGSNVVIHDCHGKNNQRWRHLSRNNRLVSNVPGRDNMCLEVGGWKTDNGANANIWKCGNNQANQRWSLTQDVTFTEVLQVQYPAGKCVDNTGGKNKGAGVHSWTCNAKNVNQQWTFKKHSGDYYAIKSRRSGLCLDVAGGKKNNGAKIVQWSCHGGNNQQWKMENAGNGWFRLKSRTSGKCLDLKGPYTDNGTPFQQWDCKNVKNQMFREVG